MDKKICFIFMLIFLLGCGTEGTRIYDINYNGKYPEGTFRADIGNVTVFTNGNGIKEVYVTTPFDFFCYSVNEEVLCKASISVILEADAGKNFLERFDAVKNNAMIINKTIIPERISFYLNNAKTEDILTVNDFQDDVTYVSVSLEGKGATEEDAKNDFLGKQKELVAVLRDR